MLLAACDGEGGAHCIHEAWMRNEPPAGIELMLERLWAAAAGNVPEWLPMRYIAWLPLVYDVAATFRPRRRGRSNIYLVLLDYADREGEPHGIYVGATRYAPSERFDQHKAGIRAAGSVLKRGLEVLTGRAAWAGERCGPVCKNLLNPRLLRRLIPDTIVRNHRT